MNAKKCDLCGHYYDEVDDVENNKNIEIYTKRSPLDAKHKLDICTCCINDIVALIELKQSIAKDIVNIAKMKAIREILNNDRE